MTEALETAISESLSAYRQVLDEFAALRNLSLGSSAETIATNADTLTRCFEKARVAHLAVDAALSTSAGEMPDTLLRWRELVKQVDEENRLLSTRFRGMMSVIYAELSSVKGGKSALKGYRPGRNTKGGRLNGTF